MELLGTFNFVAIKSKYYQLAEMSLCLDLGAMSPLMQISFHFSKAILTSKNVFFYFTSS